MQAAGELSLRPNATLADKLQPPIADRAMNEETRGSPKALFARPAASMLLNYDILAEICKSIPSVHEVLTLTATCSTLRRIGVPYLLRSRNIDVKPDGNLLKFRDFVIASLPEGRVVHLRTLEISHCLLFFPDREGLGPAPNTEDLVESLKDILRGASRLEYLHLGGPSTHIGEDDRSIYLQNLVSTGVLNILATPDVLRCVRSPLKGISGLVLPILEDSEDQVEGDEEFRREPVYPKDLNLLISHFSSTLETLRIDALNTNVTLDVNSPKYPAVRSLYVSSLLDFPRLDVLMHMFPSANLSLSLHIPEFLYPWVIPSDRQLWAEARMKNLAVQNAQGSWTSLDALSCTPTVLYLLGLKCPVKHLQISADGLRGGFDAQATEWISEALRINRPVKFCLLGLPIIDTTFVLNEVFSGGTQSITFLTLGVECNLLENYGHEGEDPDVIEHEDVWLDFLVRVFTRA